MGDTHNQKIFIIGIDGATYSLIAPWADAGALPHLARLMKNGAWGNLNSTIPPLTSPAWTSFMTGKNPGKHGLFHFISPQIGTYDFIYTNANTRKSKTIWQILSDYGKTAGVVNVPMTYPPEKINGFMISGMDTPDENAPFIYPASLGEELKVHFGEVKLEIRHLEFMRSDDKRDAVLKEMAALENHRAQVARYLIKNFPVDIFMLVFCSVDQIQHYFWHYMDTHHYRYDKKGAEKYGDAILKAYQTIDTQLGEILDAVPEDTIVVLMSDHGAGPSSNTIVYMNRYLADIGVLQFKDNRRGSLFDTVVKKLDPVLRKTLSPKQKAKIANLLPGVRKNWESRLSSLSAIDWERTRAYCYEILPTYTNIWINLKGKFPQGTVNLGAEYDELINFLTGKLYELENPKTGKKIVKNIYRKDELYSGPQSELAPDLLLSWWDDDSFTIRPSSSAEHGDIVRTLDTSVDKFVNWSGTHRMEGIFLLNGKPFKPVRIDDGIQIVDLAPTLLYLMGCPIPHDMDGKVIEAAFNEAYLKSHPITIHGDGEPSSTGEQDRTDETYSEEEADLVKKRLRALGYLD
jgi:predicted AlkP superfamily phosphohydrolase/phosphomutase